MKLIKTLFITCLAFSQQACIKDLQDDVNDGRWNHERQIIEIQFENQIGLAQIVSSNASIGTVDISLNLYDDPDLTQVELKKIQLSYQATASVKPGETLNFDNPSRTATITVTSILGETCEYTIKVSEFIEPLVGIWDIEKMTVFGGTGLEYGAGGLSKFSETWWIGENVPQNELDNALEFRLIGCTEDGNTYGICTNNPGADGKYADFIFPASKRPAGDDIDLANLYRKIPKGESNWLRDYKAKTITFTDADNNVSVMTLEEAGTENLGNGKSMKIENNAFACNLNGKDDWDHLWSHGANDVYVQHPRRYWISVRKH